MSCARLYRIGMDGFPIRVAEYQNAWGWAPFVWSALARKYDVPLSWEALWGMCVNNEIALSVWEENVLRATFDRAMVKASHLWRLSRSLEMFFQAFSLGEGANHLEVIAQDLRSVAALEGVMGVCWHNTNVTGSPWTFYENTGRETPYNFITGSPCAVPKHHVAAIEPWKYPYDV